MHIADPALQPAVVPERLDAPAPLACPDSQAKPSSFNKAHSDVYGHMWPARDETTRAAIGGVIGARLADSAGAVRAKRP
jgi:hypothetical protein